MKEVRQEYSTGSGRPSGLQFINGRRDRNALDHFCNFTDPVAFRVGERPYHGRSHSYPAGHRRHRLGGQAYSGAKNTVARTLAGGGEACGKGGGEVWEDFASGATSLAEKVL